MFGNSAYPYGSYGSYDSIGSSASMSTGSMIWLLISLIVALIGCFVVYFVFVAKKENPKQKFLAWLKSFLSFDKMLIEVILKISYVFTAIFITLSSFSFISLSFLLFLFMLIGGNLIARVIYESVLIKIMIWKNTTEIKNKLK